MGGEIINFRSKSANSMNVEKIEASKSVLQRDAENQNKGYEDIPQRRSNLGLKRRLYSALRVVLSIGALIALVCTFLYLLLIRTNLSILPSLVRVGFEDDGIQVGVFSVCVTYLK